MNVSKSIGMQILNNSDVSSAIGSSIRLYSKPSKLDFIFPKPKWYIFEGNLNIDKDLKEYILELSKFLLGGEEFIRVVGGELCSKVWSNDIIIKALETTKAKEICFICGPMIDINDHKIIELVKNEKIRLFRSSERQKEYYRVTDKGIFIEGYHEAFKPERSAIFCNNSSIIGSIYNKKFEQLYMELYTERKVEMVKAKDILEKFELGIYDQSQNDNYRAPTEEEKNEISRIVNE
jgi:hypothetical protein